MIRPHGYAQVIDPGSDVLIKERDTIQCGHCGKHISIKPGTGNTVYLYTKIINGIIQTVEEMGAFCRVCMTPVCLTCHDDGRCLPLEKRLQQLEAGLTV
jgi:hypothetical protein